MPTLPDPNDVRALLASAGSMAAKLVSNAVERLALNPKALERIASQMYKDEEAKDNWGSLAGKERQVWIGRARSAVIGFHAYVFKMDERRTT